jgi:hypothetical protein
MVSSACASYQCHHDEPISGVQINRAEIWSGIDSGDTCHTLAFLWSLVFIPHFYRYTLTTTHPFILSHTFPPIPHSSKYFYFVPTASLFPISVQCVSSSLSSFKFYSIFLPFGALKIEYELKNRQDYEVEKEH